jgi:hypothetical protein
MKAYNGYYKVGEEIIYNKIEAIVEASKQKKEVNWIYYDQIYETACNKFKPQTTTLTEIYKQRALQLRDEYDYLILNYSGGSDSNNILNTFLKNNIKLDMVFVQWPMSLVDKGLYDANTVDKSNFNFHSEWDLVIKKDLEWLRSHHPEIKIEIADWTYTVTETFYKDDLYQNNVTNLPSIARAQKQNTFSKTETELANKGMKIGSIYGVDKPMIAFKGGNVYFRMADVACMAQPNPNNPDGLEYFYFSPSMPEILLVQAEKMLAYFKLHPEKFYMAIPIEERKKLYPSTIGLDWYKDFHDYAELFKLVCYPYWDFNRFQADKPFSILSGLPMGVRAWDNILIKSLPDFTRTQNKWEYLWKSYKEVIDPIFLRNQDTISIIFTKWHKLQIS